MTKLLLGALGIGGLGVGYKLGFDNAASKWKLDSLAFRSEFLKNVVEEQMKNYNTEPINVTQPVSIVMSSYNEELNIQKAVSSVKNQSIIEKCPEYFELIVVDSNSTDKTVQYTKQYLSKSDKLIIAPRGKLTARNIGIDESKGNIIVSTDSDTYYPYHWLNTLLEPFFNDDNSDIVGVSGTTFDKYYTTKNKDFTIMDNILSRQMYPNQMIGRNSAFRKNSFYATGRFNESINQFDVNEMVEEEEIGFGNRLSKIGKVIVKFNASCDHLGGLKGICRHGLVDSEECKNYGFGINRFG